MFHLFRVLCETACETACETCIVEIHEVNYTKEVKKEEGERSLARALLLLLLLLLSSSSSSESLPGAPGPGRGRRASAAAAARRAPGRHCHCQWPRHWQPGSAVGQRYFGGYNLQTTKKETSVPAAPVGSTGCDLDRPECPPEKAEKGLQW